jgi:hypothetical protein
MAAYPISTPNTGNAMAVKSTKQYAQVWILVEASKQLLHVVARYSPGWLLPIVKSAGLMLHQNTLLAARNNELEEQLAVMTKRKTHKRKRIQQGGTIE